MIASKIGLLDFSLGEHIAYASLAFIHVLSENDNLMVATKTLLFGI